MYDSRMDLTTEEMLLVKLSRLSARRLSCFKHVLIAIQDSNQKRRSRHFAPIVFQRSVK